MLFYVFIHFVVLDIAIVTVITKNIIKKHKIKSLMQKGK